MALWGSQYLAEGGPVFTPPENMGAPTDLELGYASQFFADGGEVLPQLLAMLGDRVEYNGETYESQGPWSGLSNSKEFGDYMLTPEASAEHEQYRGMSEDERTRFTPRYLNMFSPRENRRPREGEWDLPEMWRRLDGFPTS